MSLLHLPGAGICRWKGAWGIVVNNDRNDSSRWPTPGRLRVHLILEFSRSVGLG